jgi:DNA-binding response OmpR family regulator
MMPGIDGYEVLRILKSAPATSRIAVIMLTAKSETKSLFKAQELGAADYIIKPFDFGELLSLVRRHI